MLKYKHLNQRYNQKLGIDISDIESGKLTYLLTHKLNCCARRCFDSNGVGENIFKWIEVNMLLFLLFISTYNKYLLSILFRTKTQSQQSDYATIFSEFYFINFFFFYGWVLFYILYFCYFNIYSSLNIIVYSSYFVAGIIYCCEILSKFINNFLYYNY